MIYYDVEKKNPVEEGELNEYGYYVLTGGKFYCFGDVKVKAHDNVEVWAYDNSVVWANANSEVKAHDNVEVSANANSEVWAYNNSKVRAYDNSEVWAYNNSKVRAYDNSEVNAFGNSKVWASSNSEVEAFDNSEVNAFGNSKVKASDNSKVWASSNSEVNAFGNSKVWASSNSKVWASSNSELRDYKEVKKGIIEYMGPGQKGYTPSETALAKETWRKIALAFKGGSGVPPKNQYSLDDNINQPQHYKIGDIETIDIIKSKLSKDQFKGFLMGNIIKYITRAGHKNSEIEDLKKAQWYLNKLID